MRNFFLIVLLSLSPVVSLLAQQSNYSTVDSIMRNYHPTIKTLDDLYKVVYFIRKNFTQDSLRLRASFIWITENISYDIKAFKTDNSSASRLAYVIKTKKTICSGYSALLKSFCDYFNIESKIVDGKARSLDNDINIAGSRFKANHSWNMVKVNDQWRLIDATWAAGNVSDIDKPSAKFHKEYDEFYYFTPPERFILNHFPILLKDQLLSKPIKYDFFSKGPLLTTAFLKDSIVEITPYNALINMKKGDTLAIRFKTNIQSAIICAFSENKKTEYSDYVVQKDGWLELKYPVSIMGVYNLYVGYCDRIHSNVLLTYKLEVSEKRK
jgi:transglutaminase/protease-like cytokinesis protein 3